MMNWLLLLGVLAVVGYLLDREIYFYEGTHLGPRLQSWLYDRWSKKYDEGKRASQLQDDEMLAQPLLAALKDVPEPFLLDFATGTGRLSHALLKREDFTGRIVALDLSLGMLEQAASKLNSGTEQVSRSAGAVELLRHLSLPLPFPDATFDAVCALEVLELFPQMEEPLAELTRVLRPGGVLLTSRGTEESGRKARIKNAEELIGLLEKNDLERTQITKWWKYFDRVIAVKRGVFQPIARKSLSSVLKCSVCQISDWTVGHSLWTCRNCSTELFITRQGIVLNGYASKL